MRRLSRGTLTSHCPPRITPASSSRHHFAIVSRGNPKRTEAAQVSSRLASARSSASSPLPSTTGAGMAAATSARTSASSRMIASSRANMAAASSMGAPLIIVGEGFFALDAAGSPEQVIALPAKLAERPIYAPVITALFTGLRRGELLALRWSDVNLDRKILSVQEALEETVEHGIRRKATK